MKQLAHIITLACSLWITTGTFAQAARRIEQFNVDKQHLAIGGFDPVAYFTNGKAVEGSKTITYVHDGITYRFSTAANRNTFLTNPAMYEPQYGGWCAYAMGTSGEKVEVDPKTFKIVDGKLFLFYNSFFNNTLKSWNKNERVFKTKADANWSVFFPRK